MKMSEGTGRGKGRQEIDIVEWMNWKTESKGHTAFDSPVATS